MSARVLLTGVIGIGAGSGLTYLILKDSRFCKDQTIATIQSKVPATSVDKEFLKKLRINPSEFFQYGFPGPVHDLQRRENFISCFNRQTRNPYWVLEHITPESLAMKSGNRKGSVFKEDEYIPEIFRAQLKDYFRSGYDRGHQAPAADSKFSQTAMDDTFYMTNMCPQVGQGFNRDYWAHFEFFCRDLTKKYNSVRIMTGPLYLPKKDPVDGKFRVSYEVIGNPPNVAVPTHFFKFIVAEEPKDNIKSGSVAVEAFVLPNDQIPNETKLTDFVVPINAIERSTGLEFLKALPKDKMKSLCQEVNCQIVVRDFSNKAKQLNNNNNKPALSEPLK